MSSWEKWLLWSSMALATVTGVALWAVKELLPPPGPWAVINHPIQPWLLKIHIISVPLLVFALGAFTVRHVWPHFMSGTPRGRRTGATTALVVIPMVLTGYAIQVVTHAPTLTILAWTHLGFGVLFSAGLVLHQLVLWLTRRNRPEIPEPVPRKPTGHQAGRRVRRDRAIRKRERRAKATAG